MNMLSKIMYGGFAGTMMLIAVLFFSPWTPSNHLDVKIVKSGSMEPKIMTGSIVAIRASDVYNTGDVITFDGRNSIIPTTHRIVEIHTEDGETTFTTKGDANEEADAEPALLSSVRGKVLFTIPYAGYVLDFARQPMGFALLVALPALLIVLDEIGKIWKELRRIRRLRVAKVSVEVKPLVVAPYTPVRPRVQMMDINRPAFSSSVPAIPQQALEKSTAQIPAQRKRTSMTSSWVLAPSAVLAFCALTIGLLHIEGTVSYQNDIESTNANILHAGALDFTATPDKNSFIIPNGGGGILNDTLITLVAPEEGSVPLRYSLKTEYVSGNPALCSALSVTATAPFIFDGSLSSLTATNVLFTGPWTLHITLGDGGGYTLGDTCVINFVYTGWNALLAEGSGGYDDEERTQLTFTLPAQIPLAPQFFSAFSTILPDVQTEDGDTQEKIETDAELEIKTLDGETPAVDKQQPEVPEKAPTKNADVDDSIADNTEIPN